MQIVPVRLRSWIAGSNLGLRIWFGAWVVFALWSGLTLIPWSQAGEIWHARPWRSLTTLEQCQGEAAVAADWWAQTKHANWVQEEDWRWRRDDRYRYLVQTCLEARLKGPGPR